MGMAVMICRHVETIDWSQPSIYNSEFEVNLEEGVNTIDVWWLMDDGGFSILIPHIMSQHSFWKYHETHIRMLIPTTISDVASVKRLNDTFTQHLRLNIHIEPVELHDH